MTTIEIEYCGLLVKEFFGQQPSRLFEFIVQNQPVQLKTILTRGKFTADDAKKSLWVLIQHFLVKFVGSENGIFSYEADLKYALQRARHVRYIHMSQNLFGDEAKLIVEQISRHGKADMNKVLEQITQQLADQNLGTKKLYDKFCELSSAGFVTKYPPVDDDAFVPELKAQATGVGVTSLGKRKNVESDNEDSGESNIKKPKLEDCSRHILPPIKDLFRLDDVKFHEHWRQQLIVDAIASRVDEKSAEVVKALLKISELDKHKLDASKTRTGGVPYNEISTYLRKQQITANVSQVLAILTQDPCPFIIKDGDSDGGIYKIDYKMAFTELCKAHIESIVQERYGSASKRIFRYIQMKKVIDQKQIEDSVMMDVKDARDFLFRLLKDGFLCQPEVSRGTDYMPLKTFYFFSVDLPQVAKMLLDQCYEAVSNLMRRREHESKINKRVVDKQRRLEAILEQIEDNIEQRQELEDQMSPAEKAQVAAYIKASDKIEKAELLLDETAFVFETFLSLNNFDDISVTRKLELCELVVAGS